MVLPLGELRRTRVVPVVTYFLIAINVTVFLVQQQRGEEFTRAFAMTPREVTQNEDLEGQVPSASPPWCATRSDASRWRSARRIWSTTPARSRSDGRS